MKKNALYSLFLFLILLFSCANNQKTLVSEDQNPGVNKNSKADHEKGYDELLPGKWNYIETIVKLGDSEKSSKAVPLWVMEYKKDNTFSEVQKLDKEYKAEGKYSIEGKTIKREGLLKVNILEIDGKKLILEALGTKIVFERMK